MSATLMAPDFKTLFESALDCVVVMNHEGRITEFNPAAERTFGYTREEALGQPLADLIVPPALREQHRRGLARYLATGEGPVLGRRLELTAMRKGGGEFPVELAITRLADEPPVFTGFIRDITERKRGEALVAGQNRVLESIASGAPLEESLSLLMHLLESQMPGSLCSVLLLDPDGIHLRHGAAPSLPADYNAAIDGICIGPDVGSCGTAAYLGRTVVVEDIATDPLWANFKSLALAHGLRACWSTPIHDERQHVLGTFAVYMRQPARPTADHTRLTTVATQTASIAIMRHRAQAALRESEENYRTLFEQMDEGFCTIEVIFDEQQKPVDFRFAAVNPAFERQTGIKDAVGRRIREIAPQLEEHWFETYGRVALTGEPVRFENEAAPLARTYEALAFRVGQPEERKVAVLFNDVTQRKRAAEELQQSQTELHLAMQVARMGDWSWDIASGRTEWSAECKALYGLPADAEVTRERFLRCIHPADLPAVEAAQRRALAGQGDYEAEKRVVWPDGSIRWTASRGKVLCDALGRPVRLVGITQDITERKQAEEALRQAKEDLEIKVRERTAELRAAKERAEIAGRLKSEFLASMSHELRTPLNSMLILSQLLAENPEGNLTEKQVQYATTIHGSGTDLLGLINDVLDLAKIESGTVTPESAPVAIRQVGASIERTFGPLAEQRGLEFRVEVRPGVPEILVTDERRLRQILKNLLANALKFTERGGVSLHVARASNGFPDCGGLKTARGVIAFTVKDTGIGIAEDKQQIVFDAFRQAEASTTRKYGGTGLGLAISRELARLLGGEITLASALGMGSTFTVWLPERDMPKPAEEPAATGEQAVPAAAMPSRLSARVPLPRPKADPVLAGRKALLVDDDMRNLFSLGGALERLGMKVQCAESGAQALDLLQSDKAIDIVLMDVMMPDMDGYETTRRIRSQPPFARLPIIAVTAKAMPGDREKCLESGANDYVTKPVDIDQLAGRLRALLAPRSRDSTP